MIWGLRKVIAQARAELKQRLTEMLRLAKMYNGKKEPIMTNDFLCDYRLRYGVGDYACNRYFEDFVRMSIFIENDNGTFTVSKDAKAINYAKTVFGIDISTEET
jgi:hypothetical protein